MHHFQLVLRIKFVKVHHSIMNDSQVNHMIKTFKEENALANRPKIVFHTSQKHSSTKFAISTPTFRSSVLINCQQAVPNWQTARDFRTQHTVCRQHPSGPLVCAGRERRGDVPAERVRVRDVQWGQDVPSLGPARRPANRLLRRRRAQRTLHSELQSTHSLN